MKKRIIALILCLAMALSLFTGCNSSKTGDTSTDPADGSASSVAEPLPRCPRRLMTTWCAT